MLGTNAQPTDVPALAATISGRIRLITEAQIPPTRQQRILDFALRLNTVPPATDLGTHTTDSDHRLIWLSLPSNLIAPIYARRPHAALAIPTDPDDAADAWLTTWNAGAANSTQRAWNILSDALEHTFSQRHHANAPPQT